MNNEFQMPDHENLVDLQMEEQNELPYLVKSSTLPIESPELLDALGCTDQEFIVYGSVESGKTRPLLDKLYQYHCKYPNLVSFICRKKRVDMKKSVIDQFESEILPYPVTDPRSPCERHGGQNPSAYLWKNGGITYIFGIQEAKSMLGARFDVGYVCQSEQLTLEDWEFLSHRCGRAGNLLDSDGERYGQIWGCANPDVALHWIPKRGEEGAVKLFKVKLEDNITFYQGGKWTSLGKKRKAVLEKSMTGVRYRRLIEAEWCSSEGLVFPEFDHKVHVLDHLPSDIDSWDYYLGIDYGHDSPFVCGWFAYNPQTDVLICTKEWRYTTKLIEDHVEAIKNHTGPRNVLLRVSDHDSQMNHQLEAAGLPTIDAFKEILPGLDYMRIRLRNNKLFLYKHQLIERDPVLEERQAPRDGIEEMSKYRHKPVEKHVGDSAKDDIPLKGDDHWIDLCRYVCCAIDNEVVLDMPIITAQMNPKGWRKRVRG